MKSTMPSQRISNSTLFQQSFSQDPRQSVRKFLITKKLLKIWTRKHGTPKSINAIAFNQNIVIQNINTLLQGISKYLPTKNFVLYLQRDQNFEKQTKSIGQKHAFLSEKASLNAKRAGVTWKTWIKDFKRMESLPFAGSNKQNSHLEKTFVF